MEVYNSTLKLIELVKVGNLEVTIDHEEEKYRIYHPRCTGIVKTFWDYEVTELEAYLQGFFKGYILAN